MSEVSVILKAIENGDQGASEQLLPLVYDELRHLADQKLSRESPGQTLNATALVHEAFLRLVDSANPQEWDTLGHFYSAAAEAMRRILIDIARRKKSVKHGGEFRRTNVDTLATECETDSAQWAGELIDLDNALAKFAADYPRIAELVELRYFTGLSMERAAMTLGISRRSAQRHWSFARAWLYRHVENG